LAVADPTMAWCLENLGRSAMRSMSPCATPQKKIEKLRFPPCRVSPQTTKEAERLVKQPYKVSTGRQRPGARLGDTPLHL
jgi:hypothetical protein